MKLNALLLRLLLLFVASLPAIAQGTDYKAAGINADLNSEQVTADYLLLRYLYGGFSTHLNNGEESNLTAYSVMPPTLNLFNGTEENTLNPGSSEHRIEMSFLAYIRNYYAPLFGRTASGKKGGWLNEIDDRYHLYTYSDNTVNLMCDAIGTLRPGVVSQQDTKENFLLGRLGGRAMGSLGDNFSFMIDLSNGLRFSGKPARIAQTDPILSRTLKFAIEDQKYFDRYIGYVQYKSEYVRVRFGREMYSWGFSPIDNLVHSRNAPLSDALLLDVPYKAIRFTSVHAAVEGIDLNNNAVVSKYIGSHRVQVDVTSWMSLAINDMIVYSGRGLDFAYLNPLGFYVSTGLGTKQKSDDDNSLLAAEFLIRPFQGAIVYGSLLADDIGFGTISDSSINGNNNKYAFQLGGSVLALKTPMPLLITTEYARITPFTYSHRKVNNSWTHLGAPLGYNMQPNSDRLAVQAKYWLTPRTFVQVDVDYTRWGENILNAKGNILTVDTTMGGIEYHIPIGNVGGDMLRGDGDFLAAPYNVGNKFLRGNVSHTRRIQAWLSAEVYPNIFIDTRLQYLNRNGGNNPISSTWATIELRVGY